MAAKREERRRWRDGWLAQRAEHSGTRDDIENNRTLYHGDNVEVMRSLPAESFDLIATDPPYNTGRNFGDFGDQWKFNRATDALVQEVKDAHPLLDEYLRLTIKIQGVAMRSFLYFMAIRLLEMHRLLRPTGAVLLQCDDNSSHFLKIMLGVIFGVGNFRNEIVWKRNQSQSNAVKSRLARITDRILYYAKTPAHVCYDLYLPLDPAAIEKTYKFDGRRRERQICQVRAALPDGRATVHLQRLSAAGERLGGEGVHAAGVGRRRPIVLSIRSERPHYEENISTRNKRTPPAGFMGRY